MMLIKSLICIYLLCIYLSNSPSLYNYNTLVNRYIIHVNDLIYIYIYIALQYYALKEQLRL